MALTMIHSYSVSTPSSRRQWIQNAAAAIVASSSLPAYAASKDIITEVDKERMKTGYQQIVYLLDNFDQETTVCRDNGGECKRDADGIRKVLGLRSTTDPLFQIEKVFAKVKNMDDIEDLDDFYAATEDWTSAMNMSNSMAFISQFGEYNPGGGKDEVLKYLLESKKQVVLARDALKTILDVLGVKVD